MAPARAALLGYGRIGSLHALTIREHVPSLSVDVVAEPQPSSRAAAAELGYATDPDWRAVIHRPDIDAVLIASATEMHPMQVIAAAAAGKAIFCEKPLALSLAATDAALQAVAQRQVPLQVGFQRRFDPSLTAVRDGVTGGHIGRPLLLRISARDPEPPPAWYLRFPGGLYVDSAIHDLDTARYLLGDVAEISSIGAASVDPYAAAAGDIDTAVTLLRFGNGALGALDNCRISASGFDQRIEVHGTAGTVATTNMAAAGATLATASGIRHPRNVDFFTDRYAAAYVNQFTSFAAVVAGGDPQATGADARAAFVLALASEVSRAEHRPIDVAAFTAQQTVPSQHPVAAS